MISTFVRTILRVVATWMALALVQGGTTAAAASLLGNDSSGVIYDVNTSTGAATNPRSTGINSMVGIAFRSDGVLFGLDTFAGTPTPNALFRINPTTGAATLVGATGLSNIFEGDLAFNAATNVLFGIQDVPQTGVRDLFTLNTTTGAATVVGNINAPNSDLSAMAFDAAGNLYILDTAGSTLLHVNPSNGAILGSTPLSVALAGEVAGMAVGPTTGTFYVANGHGSTNNLYTLNPTTGALTLVGPTTGAPDGLAGLSFGPTSVPEPASLVLMGLGAAALIMSPGLRRRRA